MYAKVAEMMRNLTLLMWIDIILCRYQFSNYSLFFKEFDVPDSPVVKTEPPSPGEEVSLDCSFYEVRLLNLMP